MENAMKKGLAAFLLIIGLAMCAATAAFADEGDTYVLTYPDGSTVTTTDAAEAEALQSEWKLLYTGETDEDGNIVLEGWANEAQILIRETKVPQGYTADKTETTANLADGSVTIVNTKVEKADPAPTPNKTIPRTGDATPLGLLAAIAMASLAAAFGIWRKRQNAR